MFGRKKDDVLSRRITVKLIGLVGDGTTRTVVVGDTFIVTDTDSGKSIFSVEFNSKHEVTIKVLAPFLNADDVLMKYLEGQVTEKFVKEDRG